MSHDPRHPGDRREPLTPDERALADRLARLGPHGEPSPALDARILDAARAAAGAPTAAPTTTRPAVPQGRRTRRRRWPVAIGTAATLVVVAGLAWQLRPVDDMHVAYSEAPRAVSAPSAEPPDSRQAVVTQEAAPVVEAAEPAVIEPDANRAQQADAAAAPVPVRKRAPEPVAETTPESGQPPAPAAFRQVPPPPVEPAVVFDEPSPMDTPAPPPAPPAPPAPRPSPSAKARAAAPSPSQPEAGTALPAALPAVAEDRATTAEKAKLQRAQKETASARHESVPQVASGTTTHAAEPAPASVAADTDSLDSITITGARVDGFGDQPIDDQPPASADSPQVQEAWLRRVRQLMSEGRFDEARESLREYRHRYPEATLPEDLRALLGG